MKSMSRIFILSLTFFGISLNAQDAQAICLDYWLKGPAACEEQEEEKKIKITGLKEGQVLDVKKDEERIAYEAMMDEKVDAFIANYGKPPREFVKFHLDPTLENGVRWVKKFNTDYERTMKVAVSWRQADKIFKEYKNTGKLTLPAESGVNEKQVKYLMQALEEDSTDLPEVKGFGIDLPGKYDEDRLERNYAKLDYKDKAMVKAASKLSQTGDNSLYSLKSYEKKAEKDSKQYKSTVKGNDSKQATSLSKKSNKKELTDGYPLQISYYFSDKCPFCKKFKPNLTSALKSLGTSNYKLTCVDMTPGDKKPANAKGINCDYRELLPNEAKQFGIKRTPSLLVKRNNAKSYELIENYYETKTLLNYFKYGVNGIK